jgi:hypothetical protein
LPATNIPATENGRRGSPENKSSKLRNQVMAQKKSKSDRFDNMIITSAVGKADDEATVLALDLNRARNTFSFYKMIWESEGKLKMRRKPVKLAISQLPNLAAAVVMACTVARNRGLIPAQETVIDASDEAFARFQAAWKAACEAVPDLHAASTSAPASIHRGILAEVLGWRTNNRQAASHGPTAV